MTKNLKYIILAILALQLSACSDWLTLEPEDGVTREEFWQTKEHVNSAGTGDIILNILETQAPS